MNKDKRENNHLLIRRLAWLLDSSIPIPGTKFRIGWDAVIGLIPWVGDVAGSVLSFSIMILAMRTGVSRWTLLRMGGNILVEMVVGSIPILGDIFDAAWKANERNVRLVERAVVDPRARRKDFGFLVGLGLVLLFVLGATIYGSFKLVMAIVESVGWWP